MNRPRILFKHKNIVQYEIVTWYYSSQDWISICCIPSHSASIRLFSDWYSFASNVHTNPTIREKNGEQFRNNSCRSFFTHQTSNSNLVRDASASILFHPFSCQTRGDSSIMELFPLESNCQSLRRKSLYVPLSLHRLRSSDCNWLNHPSRQRNGGGMHSEHVEISRHLYW